MSKITLKQLPCIKDQAYFTMVGMEGSWMFDATYPQNQDKAWCKQWLQHFVDQHGWLEDYPTDKTLLSVQEMIDDSYEDILRYRIIKLAEA